MNKRITLWVVLGVSALVAAFDVFLLLDGVPGNTMSSVLQAQTWVAGPLGFIAVHVARKPDEKAATSTWAATIAGSLIALVASLAIGGGLLSLICGAGVGWVTWGNSGRT